MRLSNTLWALLRRECYRFLRLAGQTVAAPVLTALLFVLVFGYSLGGTISQLHGFPYVVYILPGLAAQGVMINAYTNTVSSLYMARFDHTIDNWLAAPLSPLHLVIALVSGGVARGLIVGLLTIGVSMLLVDVPLVAPWLMVGWIVLLAVLFACLGIVSGLYADGWDHLTTVTNFVLTPLTYLGGVFYSIDMLPEPWRTISHGNPMWYGIDGMRAATLGVSDLPGWISGSAIIGATVVSVAGTWWLIKRGWRLVR